MNNIVYISDYFLNEIVGGGELNDNELTNIIELNGNKVLKLKSNYVTVSILETLKNSSFIVSNFVNLHPSCIDYFCKNLNYIIYEHDHKYLVHRNPAIYENFTAPIEHIVNYEFYKNAKSIFCQSTFHKNIIYKNLKLDNIFSVGGNLWSIESLNLIEKLSNNTKNSSFAVLDSNISHKNTYDAVMYCRYKNYDFCLIKDANYSSFLSKLSLNKGLVFFPKTPETLSRLCVEARMMNLEVITNNLVGATQEKWFNMKGKELVDFCRETRYNIYNSIMVKL